MLAEPATIVEPKRVSVPGVVPEPIVLIDEAPEPKVLVSDAPVPIVEAPDEVRVVKEPALVPPVMSVVNASVPPLLGNDIALAEEAVDERVVAFTPVPMTRPEAAVVAVSIVPWIAPLEVTVPAFHVPDVIAPVFAVITNPL